VEDVPEIAVGVMMLPGKNGEDDQFVIRLIGTGNSMKRAISHSGIADGEWDEWIANDSVQFAAVAAVE